MCRFYQHYVNNVNYFASNCKVLRIKKGLTPKAAGELVGVSRTSWVGYENGDAYPNVPGLMQIVDKFDTTATDLLERDLSKPLSAIRKGQPELTGNVYDMDTKAAAGMPSLLEDTDKFRQLPTLYIPDLGPGIHIRTQITGDSMDNTIKDGDHVIATFVADPATEIREGFIYLIMDKDEGLVCKRIYRKDPTHLKLASDNEVYRPYNRHVNDILGIFKVVEVHRTDLRSEQKETKKEVDKLWQAIREIQLKLPS